MTFGMSMEAKDDKSLSSVRAFRRWLRNRYDLTEDDSIVITKTTINVLIVVCVGM